TGFLLGATPSYQQISILAGAAASALVLGPILLELDATARTYVPAAQVAPDLRVPSANLAGLKTEFYPSGSGFKGKMRGLLGLKSHTEAVAPRKYFVWFQPDAQTGDNRKFLLDETGKAAWLVDPGINGEYTTRPDGTQVRKFSAPKATLMSYIVRGILDRKLPWALVLFGVMISLVLELSGIPSLAFAVGVYLP